MVPIYSFGTVSCSLFIATMAVSEIFSVEWRDLEIWVRGRSKSLKEAPCNRPYYDLLLVWRCEDSYILYYFR